MFADVLVGVLVALIGLLFLVSGYRFFLLLLPLWGFLAGFWAGASAMTALFGTGFLSTATSWIAGLLIGLVCAALSYLFYWGAIVLFSMSLGATAGSGLVDAVGIHSQLVTVLVAIVFALAMAALVLLLNLPKLLIVIASAFAGATAIIAGFLLLFDKIPRAELYHGAALAIIGQSFFWSIAWLVLIVVGIMLQTVSTTHFTAEMPEPPLSTQV